MAQDELARWPSATSVACDGPALHPDRLRPLVGRDLPDGAPACGILLLRRNGTRCRHVLARLLKRSRRGLRQPPARRHCRIEWVRPGARRQCAGAPRRTGPGHRPPCSCSRSGTKLSGSRRPPCHPQGRRERQRAGPGALVPRVRLTASKGRPRGEGTCWQAATSDDIFMAWAGRPEATLTGRARARRVVQLCACCRAPWLRRGDLVGLATWSAWTARGPRPGAPGLPQQLEGRLVEGPGGAVALRNQRCAPPTEMRLQGGGDADRLSSARGDCPVPCSVVEP